MIMVLEKLVEFSNFYGSNEELVLAGGGNTSAKDGDVMYIKGSGTSLSTITKDGFVKMNRANLKEIFSKTYPENDKEREALFYAVLAFLKGLVRRVKEWIAKSPTKEYNRVDSF